MHSFCRYSAVGKKTGLTKTMRILTKIIVLIVCVYCYKHMMPISAVFVISVCVCVLQRSESSPGTYSDDGNVSD